MTSNFLSLGKGHPNTSDLPYSALIDAVNQSHQPSTQSPLGEEHSFANSSPHLFHDEALQYGDDAGSLRFRKALFLLLEKQRPALRGYRESFVQRILQTNGASQGIDMICGTLASPGDVILVETPTYFYAKDIFEQRGLLPMQIPTNHDKGGSSSMDLHALEKRLENKEIQPRLLYTVPVCNNPMGFTLSKSDSGHLVLLARKYGFHIVADEVYFLLQFINNNNGVQEDESTESASLMDVEGALDVVISVNSFSKILGPGIRLGWIEAKPSIIDSLLQTSVIQSGGGLNPFSASIVSTFIESGKQAAHIQHLRREYQQRYNILTQALKTHLDAIPVHVSVALGESCSRTCFVPANGGYFVWLRFASTLKINAEELMEMAPSSHGVSALPGKRFLVGHAMDKSSAAIPSFIQESVRLCFAFLDEPDLETAVQRLALSLDSFRQRKNETRQ